MQARSLRSLLRVLQYAEKRNQILLFLGTQFRAQNQVKELNCVFQSKVGSYYRGVPLIRRAIPVP